MNLFRLATHPLTILGATCAGGAMGVWTPDLARQLGFVGQIYLNLLSMVVLPFLMVAVVLSIYRLTSNAHGSHMVVRIVAFLFIGMAVTGVAGIIIGHTLAPGTGMDASTMATLGRLLEKEATGADTSITLLSVVADPAPENMMVKLLARMVPSNIFHALSAGDTLKSMFFAVLFGLALSRTPSHLVKGVLNACDAVFAACQRMTAGMMYLLPPVTLTLVAEQIANGGFEPFSVMLRFILAFAGVTTVLLCLCILVIRQRSGYGLGRVLESQKNPFVLALATCNSASCMPSMMAAMVDHLHFDKDMSELLVPLGTALLRVGPVLFYCMATLFIAQLYGRDMGLGDYAVVLLASLLTGFASAGMTGIVSISQTSVVCALLGLPFEAAFVLFMAVEPLCNPLRTSLLVISTNTLVALIAPRSASSPNAAAVAA